MKPGADKTQDTSSGIVWGIFVILLLGWAAHIYATYFPSGLVWGLLHGTVLSPLWRWVIWLVGLLLIFPPVAGVVARHLAQSRLRLPQALATKSPLRQFIMVILLFGILFIFRSSAHIFGDGYRMLDRLAEAGPSVLFRVDILKETFDFGWHWLNHRLWAEPLGISPAFTYGLLNCIAGVLIILGLTRLIEALTSTREHRLLLWTAVLSSGTLMLSFGYVESYSWALAGSIWALAYAIRALKRPELWRVSIIIWLIAVGFHLLALIFAPVFLWAWWLRHREQPVQPSWIFIILGGLVFGCAIPAVYLLGSRLFVFPVAGDNSPYLLWSLAHLFDLLNILLLVAPAALSLVIILFFPGKRVKLSGGWSLVAIAAAGAWWAAVVIDPSLGAARDWDLISYFGPFLTLTAAGILLLKFPQISKNTVRVLAVQFCGLALFHTVPWIVAHQDAERAVELMDVMLVDDPHLSEQYNNASRAVDFGQFLISDEVKRYDLGTKYFSRRVAAIPDDPDAWWSLGSMYWYRGLPDSCYWAYRKSLRADSTNAEYWHNFGLLLLSQNLIAEAKSCFGKVLNLRPDNWQVAWGLGDIYRRQKKRDSAVMMFRRVAQIKPDFWEAYCAAGVQLMHQKEYPAALGEFDQAIRLNPHEPIMRRRELEIQLLNKNMTAMQNVLYDWRRTATSQTKDEILQWDAQLNALKSPVLDDSRAAELFFQMGEWYASRALEHVAFDCLYLATQLDSVNVTYRTRYETLRAIIKQRPGEYQ